MIPIRNFFITEAGLSRQKLCLKKQDGSLKDASFSYFICLRSIPDSVELPLEYILMIYSETLYSQYYVVLVSHILRYILQSVF